MKYLFPKQVKVFNDEHQLISFGPGLVEVDPEFDNHWFFKANGATPIDEDGNEIVEEDEAEEESTEEDAPTGRRKKRNR